MHSIAETTLREQRRRRGGYTSGSGKPSTADPRGIALRWIRAAGLRAAHARESPGGRDPHPLQARAQCLHMTYYSNS
jgi:hypothetical protein